MRMVKWLFFALFLQRLVAQIPIETHDTLIEAASFSALAYCITRNQLTEGNSISNSSCPLQLCQDDKYSQIKIVSIFNPTGEGVTGTGYIALDENRKRIIVAFRGSSSRRDWFSDIEAFPIRYHSLTSSSTCKGCKVHKGFYRAHKSYLSDLVRKIKKLHLQYSDYELLVTGHSLGAALTILTGIELQLLGFQPLVVTFASPKVGNYYFSRWTDEIFQSKKSVSDGDSLGNNGLIRVVHKGDYVPLLPPSPLYYHSGMGYCINKKEIPHSAEDVDYCGLSAMNDDVYNATVSESDIKEVNIETLPKGRDYLNSYEHSRYFMKVTGCGKNGS